MNSQRELILQAFSEIWELAEDVRFGQLIANITSIGEANTGCSIWDLEDDEMLKVLEQHRNDLRARCRRVAESKA